MCVAVPGRVERIEEMAAIVDVGGATVRARIDLLPDVNVGEYVLVHAGFALEKMDEEDAQETLRLLAEVDRLYQESLNEEQT
jgi:hydrogenase expression/formation protein HypC